MVSFALLMSGREIQAGVPRDAISVLEYDAGIFDDHLAREVIQTSVALRQGGIFAHTDQRIPAPGSAVHPCAWAW